MPLNPRDVGHMVYGVSILLLIPAIPCLIVFACLGWLKRFRKELPGWRNVLSVISIVATSLSWLTFFSPFFVDMIGFKLDYDPVIWGLMILLLAATGTTAGLASKGTLRIQAVTAGILMIVFFSDCRKFYYAPRAVTPTDRTESSHHGLI
jgi:hypothetical protein